MPSGDARYRVELEAEPGTAPEHARPAPDTPFRIAILGDFTGRGRRHAPRDLAACRAVRVDRDNLDEVLARLAPELSFGPDSPDFPTLTLRFNELDDFHPDRLYTRVPLFHALRQLRARLEDSHTFASAAAELLGQEEPPPEARAASNGDATGGGLLERMLDEAVGPSDQPAPRQTTPPPDDLQAFVRRVVAPHREAAEDPRQSDLITRVDDGISDQMRRLLHAPRFQALESLWRALWFLTRRVETEARLQIHIFDIALADIQRDLGQERPIEETGLYRALVAASVGTPGAERWAVVTGCYTFGATDGDVSLLARLGEIARRAGAPLLAGAAPSVVGVGSFENVPEVPAGVPATAAWTALRRQPVSRWIGLAAPRFLIREPYGRDSDPCEGFGFEELGDPPGHDHYLWANGAWACTLLLAQAFSRHGWAMRPGMLQDVEGLPLHLYREAGSTVAKPCAETLMTETAASRIMAAGPMVLASLKGTDAIRLVRFQSMADPVRALAGGWSEG